MEGSGDGALIGRLGPALEDAVDKLGRRPLDPDGADRQKVPLLLDDEPGNLWPVRLVNRRLWSGCQAS